MSTILNKNDVLVRLQLGGCCAGNKTSLLVKQLMYGGDNIKCLSDDLELIDLKY